MKNDFSPRVVNHLLFAGLLMGAVTLFSFNLAALDLFHSENGNTKKGNSFLDAGKSEKALTMYNKAAKELPDNGKVHLNRGLALLRSGDDKLDEAMQALTLATNSDSDNSVLARANYNLGNAFFKKEDYDEAIKHYKKSLMLSPGNKDAAWNLEVARLNKKKKEEEQKKKQDQDKQNQDKQNQDKQDQDKQNQDKQNQDKQNQDKQDQDKQNQDKQDQDKKDQEKQKQDQQKQDQQKKEQQQQQQQQQPQETPDKKQMDKILKAIENEDSNFHKNKARARGLRNAAGSKDW